MTTPVPPETRFALCGRWPTPSPPCGIVEARSSTRARWDADTIAPSNSEYNQPFLMLIYYLNIGEYWNDTSLILEGSGRSRALPRSALRSSKVLVRILVSKVRIQVTHFIKFLCISQMISKSCKCDIFARSTTLFSLDIELH